MRRDLIKFVTLLNENEKSFYDNWYTFKLKETTRMEDDLEIPCYSLKINDTDFNIPFLTLYTKGRYNDLEDNIQSFIGAVYSQEINFRKSYVNNFRGAYLTRKMKSLSRAIEKNDTDKISKINNEMIEKFDLVEKCKSQIQDFKFLVARLYDAKNELCHKKETVLRLVK